MTHLDFEYVRLLEYTRRVLEFYATLSFPLYKVKKPNSISNGRTDFLLLEL